MALVRLLYTPRVILLEERGSLIGLITVKDVLTFIAMEGAYSPKLNYQRRAEDIFDEAWSWFSSFPPRSFGSFHDLLNRSHTGL